MFLHKSTKGFRKFAQSPAQGAAGTVLRGEQAEETSLWAGMVDSAKSNFNAYTGKYRKGEERPMVVVYGHDAKGGLRIKRWTKGLDSACVGGGRLSALVVDARGEGEVVDVGCPGYW